jgi:hypothetical protein
MRGYFRAVMEISDERRISEVGESTRADCEAGAKCNRHESESNVLLSPTLSLHFNHSHRVITLMRFLECLGISSFMHEE